MTESTKSLLALMWISLLLNGCGSQSGQQAAQEIDCHLKAKSSCVHQSEGESLRLQLDSFRENQEYIFVVWSKSEIKDGTYRKSLFQIRSAINSKSPHEDESRQRRKLLRQLPRDVTESQTINIPSPGFIRNQVNDGFTDFYIPHVNDYQSSGTIDQNTETESAKSRSFYVRSSEDPRVSGSRADFQLVHEIPRQAEIFLNEEHHHVLPNIVESSECIDQTLPSFLNFIGRPVFVGNKPEINLLVSPILSSSKDVIGAFNFTDLFSSIDGSPIPDSNFSETLYFSPKIKGEKLCSTIVHEAQHLLSYLHKVLKHLPENQRHDYKFVELNELQREDMALDEGYSHAFEDIIVGAPHVFRHMARFLRNPTRTSFLLELADLSDLDNYKTRGLATLLIYHAIARAGGKLDPNDPVTFKLLKSLITQKSVGIENLARQFEEDEISFVAEFFRRLFVSLYYSSQQEKFIPMAKEIDSRWRGLRFLDAEDEEFSFDQAEFHPYLVDLPVLQRASRWTLGPESLAFTRFIVPDLNDRRLNDKKYLEFSSRSAPFILQVIRVR